MISMTIGPIIELPIFPRTNSKEPIVAKPSMIKADEMMINCLASECCRFLLKNNKAEIPNIIIDTLFAKIYAA